MPRTKKKRKLSGLSGLELQLAYDSLLKLKKTIVEESEEDLEADPNEPTPESLEQLVDTMRSLLGSKLEGPQSLAFSSMTVEALTKLKITFSGGIALKPNSQNRIGATTSLGKDELWSSANLYRQLLVLETLIPRTTEASARAWIEVFFFRVSAMLPPNQRMVLNMEHGVPATTISPSNLSTLSGFVDYTVAVASQRTAAYFLQNPLLHVLKSQIPSSFFVVEANLFNPLAHVPQAVCGMYACGRLLQKKLLRGALTNGRDWIFLIIKLNDDYDGASFKQSSVIELTTTNGLNGELAIAEPWPDLIAAILSYWIDKSFADLESDDWFEPV